MTPNLATQQDTAGRANTAKIPDLIKRLHHPTPTPTPALPLPPHAHPSITLFENLSSTHHDCNVLCLQRKDTLTTEQGGDNKKGI